MKRHHGSRAVLLGRVSRGERTQTTRAQLEPLRAAAKRLGLVVAAEVSIVLSAWNSEAAADVRRQALAPIVAGKADVLMVWSWDRFSREGIEGAFRELRYLEQHLGAAFWSLQEPFLCTAADPQQRELLLSIVAWAAHWESERRSERITANARMKRIAAGKLGQRATWGGGRLASPDELRRARQLRRDGLSIRTIADRLKISKSQVHRIFSTEGWDK